MGPGRLRSSQPRAAVLVAPALVALAFAGGCAAGSPVGSAAAPVTIPLETTLPSAESTGVTGEALCAVVGDAQIQAATGLSVSSRSALDGECKWILSGESNSVLLRIEAADSKVADMKYAFPGGRDVAGVGDAAYWSDLGTTLWFVKAGRLYAVQEILASGATANNRLDAARSVALAALAKL